MPGHRPPLREAAQQWLATTQDDAGVAAALREALTDFLGDRYRGAAVDLKRVQDIRRRYVGDQRPLRSMGDPASVPPWENDTLDGATTSSAPNDQGRLLYHLVRRLQPRRVLELGTNIGVSAAYIALGLRHGSGGKLTTIEASGIRLELARSHFAELGLEGIQTVEGYFDDVLPGLLAGEPRVELAFIDGNHKRDATVAYFRMLRDHMGGGRLIVLDDIRWSDGMEEAWEEISKSPQVGIVADLGRTGLVVTR